MLQTNTVNQYTLELLNKLSSHTKLNDFFLVGGTALALQIGHRISIDLDFFSINSFKEDELTVFLEQEFDMEIFQVSKNSITGKIKDIKVDFISHQYPLLSSILSYNSIKLAALEDISAMKLNAIKNRGTKKDFVDLYFLLKQFTLEEMLNFANKKYPNHSDMLTVKSLVYFDDADLQPDCEMLVNVSWDEVKNTISQHTLKFL